MKCSINICAIALLSAALFILSSCVVTPYDGDYSSHGHHDYDHHGYSHYDGGHYDGGHDDCYHY